MTMPRFSKAPVTQGIPLLLEFVNSQRVNINKWSLNDYLSINNFRLLVNEVNVKFQEKRANLGTRYLGGRNQCSIRVPGDDMNTGHQVPRGTSPMHYSCSAIQKTPESLFPAIFKQIFWKTPRKDMNTGHQVPWRSSPMPNSSSATQKTLE